MKKAGKLCALLIGLLIAGFTLAGCGSKTNKKVTFYVLDVPSGVSMNLWMWNDEGNYTDAAWPGDLTLSGPDSDGCYYLETRIDATYDTGVIIVDSTGKKYSGDITISSAFALNNKKIYLVCGVDNCFASYDEACAGRDNTMKAEEIDANYVYTGNDLGVKISGGTASFKTWAPMAESVTLLLYSNSNSLSSPASTVEMSKGDKGTWSASGVSTSYKYYKYRIKNPDGSQDVADIWSYAASADSVASQIVDINAGTSYGSKSTYKNPFKGDYSKAVIYEMHIRDWSRAFVPSSTGKFKDITDNLGDTGKFAAHLKDLGVTHVQILPMFDYAEKNSDSNYNWGYNPYHYNVPEGRYVKNMTDGTDAVNQAREMIEAFHKQGIAVIMDVVYNHTSGTGKGSLYDMTVPKYFYRTTGSSYSNGSGCGNEVATNHAMVKKYVIDSLKHWMLDYHINGFRFDLMGCLESSTMAEIYEALSEIDPNVMVYGEPWTGGDSAVSGGADKAVSAGVGAFDDSFRDAIKGAEFGGFKKGQVQGTFNDSAIIKGLTGASTTRNNTGKPELSIHYAECHDNYTLFDKLSISLNNGTSKSGWKAYSNFSPDNQEKLKNEDKLAAAYVILSQGTPFLNGGQEFLRTKKGDENSYSSSDDINQISLSFKDTYSDVYNTYKGLIALRKENPEAFGKNTSASATKVSEGVTKYTTGGFTVFFNATDSSYDISGEYTTCIDVSSGTPDESDVVPSSVGAKSFVILK